MAGDACIRLPGKADLANTYAEEAVKQNPNAVNQARLFTTLHNLALPKFFNSNDYAGALELLRGSIAAYQACQRATDFKPELIPVKQIAAIFAFAARCAQKTGQHEEANKFAQKSVEVQPSIYNEAILITTLHNVGRKNEANAKLEDLVKSNPNDEMVMSVWKGIKSNPNAAIWIIDFR